MSNTTEKMQARMSFAAIDPFIQQNIVLPTESKSRGGERIDWGTGNRYPNYLLELYNTVPTLRAIINGNVDFITGDEVSIQPLTEDLKPGTMNRRGDTIREQVRDIAKDYEIYGGFCLQVIRDFAGRIAEIYYLDMRFVRMNKDCNVFYYCEDWGRVGHVKVQTYPAFLPGLENRWAELDEKARDFHASSILFVKSVHTQTYPAPLYAASVKDCEIERNITDYHLNSLSNGFVSSLIVNFNNGIPTDEIKEEIENAFNEKFTGHQNAGRVMFSWNKNKESATDIVEPKLEDFGERYKALSTHSRQQIFAAFRAVPALFGIMTESTGFNEQEFSQAFRLYNRTQIRPVQRIIGDAYERIYGVPQPLTIKPFSIEETTTETTVQ
jgi:hypothetical protein